MKRYLLLLLSAFSLCAYANQNSYYTVPDSVYLRAYAKSTDAGKSGLKLDWSVDEKTWFQVAKDTDFFLLILALGEKGKVCMTLSFLDRTTNGFVYGN